MFPVDLSIDIHSIQLGFFLVLNECVRSSQQGITSSSSANGLADNGDNEDSDTNGDDMMWLVYSMAVLVALTILGIVILLIVCIRMKYKERHHNNIYKWEIKHNVQGGRLRPMDPKRRSEKATPSPIGLNNNSNSNISHIYRLPNLEDVSSHSNSEPSADERREERPIPAIIEPDDDLSSVAGTVGSMFSEESPC